MLKQKQKNIDQTNTKITCMILIAQVSWGWKNKLTHVHILPSLCSYSRSYFILSVVDCNIPKEYYLK